MTSTQDVSAPTDAEFVEFLDSLLTGEQDNSSTDADTDGDWLDALLADCAESINSSPIGEDHIATPVRDKTGGHKHRVDVHHRKTGKKVASLDFSG